MEEKGTVLNQIGTILATCERQFEMFTLSSALDNK